MHHHDHGIERGQAADQQQRRVAETVDQPAAQAALLPLHQLVAGDQHHHERDEHGPKRRGLREYELEHEAHGRQLHRHAHRGDAEAHRQPQAEGERDRPVDDEQQGRQREIGAGELHVAHAAALSKVGACPLRPPAPAGRGPGA